MRQGIRHSLQEKRPSEALQTMAHQKNFLEKESKFLQKSFFVFLFLFDFPIFMLLLDRMDPSVNSEPRISSCRWLRRVKLTYGERKSKLERRKMREIGLIHPKKSQKTAPILRRAQKIPKN
jgi:hypothetical protein